MFTALSTGIVSAILAFSRSFVFMLITMLILPAILQENLGHATAAFTLDIYGHVLDEMKHASASRMEELIQGFAAGQADSGLAVSNT